MAKRTNLYNKMTTFRQNLDKVMKEFELQNIAEDLLATKGVSMTTQQIDGVEATYDLGALNTEFNGIKAEFQTPA